MRDISYDDRATHGETDRKHQEPNTAGVEIPSEMFDIISYALPETGDAVMDGILDLLADV